MDNNSMTKLRYRETVKRRRNGRRRKTKIQDGEKEANTYDDKRGAPQKENGECGGTISGILLIVSNTRHPTPYTSRGYAR